MDHCQDELRFPISSDYYPAPWFEPLRWTIGEASEIATYGWLPRWEELTRRLGATNLQMQTDVDYRKMHLVQDRHQEDVGISVALETSGRRTRRQLFAAVVLAVGHGGQQCHVPILDSEHHYYAYPFWSSDDYDTLNGASVTNVTISGGGDGALQDLLRVVTGYPSPRSLIQDLGIEFSPELSYELCSAENRWERARVWSIGTARETHLQMLQATHDRAVDEVLRRNPDIPRQLSERRANRPRNVSLVYPSATYTCYYPLNRFVATLLCRATEIRQIREHSVTGVEWVETNPIESSLDYDQGNKLVLGSQIEAAETCARFSWRVHIKDLAEQPDSHIAQRLIVRHGLERLGQAEPSTDGNNELYREHANQLPPVPCPEPPVSVP